MTPIYGGQEYGRQIRSLKRGTHVVVATPGRALDHINRGTLKLDAVKAVVLDEADRDCLTSALPTNWMPSFEALPEGGNMTALLLRYASAEKLRRFADEHSEEPRANRYCQGRNTRRRSPRVPQIAYIVGRNYRTAALGRILDLEDPELASSSPAPATKSMS